MHETPDVLADPGFGIAVDDFGTGYPALTTLRTSPVDVVAIGKSFVAGAAAEVADQVVLAAIAQTADRLWLHTVADGVERGSAGIRPARGITAVEGHLRQRPVSAAELTAWPADRADRPLSDSAA